MLREVCASKTNTPAVVRSKHHANDDALERAFGNVCPFFFSWAKVECFSNQANKHLWSSCTVLRGMMGDYRAEQDIRMPEFKELPNLER